MATTVVAVSSALGTSSPAGPHIIAGSPARSGISDVAGSSDRSYRTRVSDQSYPTTTARAAWIDASPVALTWTHQKSNDTEMSIWSPAPAVRPIQPDSSPGSRRRGLPVYGPPTHGYALASQGVWQRFYDFVIRHLAT